MQQKKNYRKTVIATINGVDILASPEDDQLVQIRPICDMLGVDLESQRQKLKWNPLYNLVAVLSTVTGADSKQYEMYCLPFEYCLAWMLGVNAANVKPEVRKKLLEYQKECVLALKEHFYGKHRQREKSIERSAKLESERQNLINMEDMPEAFRKYLEIEKEMKNERSDRSKASRKAFIEAFSLFTPQQMKG